MVVRLKYCKSAGQYQGIVLPAPMTLLRATATIKVILLTRQPVRRYADEIDSRLIRNVHS